MGSIRLRTQNFLLLCLVIILSGCGGGGGSSVATTSVSGSVVAGPVNGAKITVKSTAGTVIAGPVFSGSDGSYTVPVPTAELANDLVFEASDGSFDDEADQTTSGKGVPMGTLSAYIAGGGLASGSRVTIDPSSTIIRKMIAGGKTKAAAESSFNAAFGYTPDCSIKPAFVNMSTASTDRERLAGLRIAAFSQLTKDLINDPTKQFALIDALSDDLSDDSLDGKKAGASVTASGTVIPEDISNKFVAALVAFHTSALNKTKLTSDKIGTLPFNKTALTASYKVEYLPGTMAAAQGKTSFKIRLTNLAGNTTASGKTLTLVPYMHMATKSHSTPVDPVIIDNGDGTYSCTVYYLMSTAMNGISMGFWELRVKIDNAETAIFFPTVGMAIGTTARTTLTGVNDSIAAMGGGTEKRAYNLFFDGLTGTSGNYTFNMFVSAKESMLSWPGVSVGSQLHDASGVAWIVDNTMKVEVSTDGSTWLSAIDSGNGHWSAAGLTGLSTGSKIFVKITVNGEQKTTDGLAVATANGYQTFTVKL